MTAAWVSPVLFAADVQCCVLAAAILVLAPGTAANRRLAGALLVVCGVLSLYVLGWTGKVEVPAWLAFLPVNLPLALGPLLWGYVVGLTSGRAPEREWRHFIPAAIQLAYLAVLSLTPEDIRVAWKEAWHDDYVKALFEAAVLVSLCAYGIDSLARLRRYRRWLAEARSDEDRYASRWLSRVAWTLLFTLAVLTAMRLYTWSIAEIDTAPVYLWLAAWSAWLGVEGWRHAFVRFPAMEPATAPVAVEEPAPARDWRALGEEWRGRIDTAGWWREPSLTLKDAALRLGTNATYLSRALNEGLRQNFNEAINDMRAAEAARMIEAGSGGDLLALAYEVGFSSKATFNRAFRRHSGHSPSDHRARLRSGIS